jgi:hypothetical protein
MKLALVILLGLAGCAHAQVAKYAYQHRCQWVHGLCEDE